MCRHQDEIIRMYKINERLWALKNTNEQFFSSISCFSRKMFQVGVTARIIPDSR